MATNPLVLNIQFPVSKKNHVGQSKPLSPSEIIGMQFIIDGNPNAILVNFAGTAYSLDGFQAYADLTPGEHTLSVAVVTKAGLGKFTPPMPFTIADGEVDAPIIELV